MPSSESPFKLMRTPRVVDIAITSSCNLQCLYCYHFNNPELDYKDLNAVEWQTFFKELGNLSIMSVCLAGGEPFVRKDLPEILDGIVENRMRYSILSNGMLINDKLAELVSLTGRCNGVQVSLDGSCPEINDICRGAGSFAGAVRGIKILQNYKIPVTVRVTISKYNLRDLDKTVQFLLDDLGIEFISTNSAGFLGSCKLNSENVQLDLLERQEAMKALLNLAKKYKTRIGAAAGPLADARIWREMENSRLNGAIVQGKGRLTGCGCAFSKIAVRSDGAIVPCNMLSHIILGWINKDSLQDIWQCSSELNRIRSRSKIALDEFVQCKGCKYVSYCTGNCPGLGYNLTGNIYSPSPDACLKDYLAAGGVIP